MARPLTNDSISAGRLAVSAIIGMALSLEPNLYNAKKKSPPINRQPANKKSHAILLSLSKRRYLLSPINIFKLGPPLECEKFAT
jgi:hypothetical protein